MILVPGEQISLGLVSLQARITIGSWYTPEETDSVKVFEFIQSLDYIDFYVVIARKIPELFINKHHSKTHEFYFDLVNKLISRLELNTENEYKMFLAQRQSSTEQRFVESVEKVIKKQFQDERIISAPSK